MALGSDNCTCIYDFDSDVYNQINMKVFIDPNLNMVAIHRSNQLEQNQEQDLDLDSSYQPLPSRPTTPNSHVSSTSHHSSPSLHHSPSHVSLHPSSAYIAIPLVPQLASEIKSHPLFQNLPSYIKNKFVDDLVV